MAYRSRSRGGWGGYPPYVPAATRAARATRAAQKLAKEGRALEPVRSSGRAVSTTFWGQAWCRNLERYSDYSNRLPRGRSYLTGGHVIDLKIQPGKITALVQGTRLYTVNIAVSPLDPARWVCLKKASAGRIQTVIALLRGQLGDDLLNLVCTPDQGLFPAPREIKLDCSCPDWAGLCKHLAAVLYGVAVRLDHHPELLFALRSVDHLELVTSVTTVLADSTDAKTDLAQDDLGALFGIDLVQTSPKEEPRPPKTPPARPRRTSPRPARPRSVGRPADTSRAVGAAGRKSASGRTTPSATKAQVTVITGPDTAPWIRPGTAVELKELTALGISLALASRWAREGVLGPSKQLHHFTVTVKTNAAIRKHLGFA